jgi:hypothetical protein
MTHRERVTIEVALVIVILTGLGIYSWSEIRRSHDLVAAAEAKSSEADALRKADKEQAEKIAANQQQQIEELRDAFAKIKTPAQAQQVIPQYFPGVQPTVIQVPVPAQAATATSPATPATTQQMYVMTPEQLMTLAKQGEQCKECEVNLFAERNTNGLINEELKVCTEEVKTWKNAAKGGSLWHRLTHDVALTSVAILTGVIIGGITVAVVKPFRTHHHKGGTWRPQL